MSRIDVGDAAPELTLSTQSGEQITLADYRGEKAVVVFFYPKDGTKGCTTEACEFTEGLAGFDKLDAAVVGISPDSAASHRKFIGKYKLGLTLLSDPDHKVMEAYGAWGEKTLYGKKGQGVIRSTVLIDPNGKVAHHWPKVKASGHAGQVREKLAKLQDKR